VEQVLWDQSSFNCFKFSLVLAQHSSFKPMFKHGNICFPPVCRWYFTRDIFNNITGIRRGDDDGTHVVRVGLNYKFGGASSGPVVARY
jgi:hypothetical protein